MCAEESRTRLQYLAAFGSHKVSTTCRWMPESKYAWETVPSHQPLFFCLAGHVWTTAGKRDCGTFKCTCKQNKKSRQRATEVKGGWCVTQNNLIQIIRLKCHFTSFIQPEIVFMLTNTWFMFCLFFPNQSVVGLSALPTSFWLNVDVSVMVNFRFSPRHVLRKNTPLQKC